SRAMTVGGLVAAGAGLIVLIAGRLHVMLHLFQLEHYESEPLGAWGGRAHRRTDRELLGLCAAAGAALTFSAAADLDFLVLVLRVVAGAAMAALGRRPLRRRPAT